MKIIFLITGIVIFFTTSVFARFNSIDPKSSSYPSVSPYVYTLNNPLKYYDPDGKDAVPIVFKDYLIGGTQGGLGHAGVLLIDNKSGLTKYWEYGRYGDETGIVRKIDNLSNVVIDSKTGLPTESSLAKVFDEISKHSGQGGDITSVYIQNDKFNKMNDLAKKLRSQNKSQDKEKYSEVFNNCMSFVQRILEEGGVDTPWMIDPRPNSYIDELRNKFKELGRKSEKNYKDKYDASNE